MVNLHFSNPLTFDTWHFSDYAQTLSLWDHTLTSSFWISRCVIARISYRFTRLNICFTRSPSTVKISKTIHTPSTLCYYQLSSPIHFCSKAFVKEKFAWGRSQELRNLISLISLAKLLYSEYNWTNNRSCTNPFVLPLILTHWRPTLQMLQFLWISLNCGYQVDKIDNEGNIQIFAILPLKY